MGIKLPPAPPLSNLGFEDPAWQRWFTMIGSYGTILPGSTSSTAWSSITLPTVNAGYFFSGPTSGTATASFRQIASSDIPTNLSITSITLSSSITGQTLKLTGATPTVASGQVGLGTTVSTSATAGTVAVPAQAAGFLEVNIGGTMYKVPYYNI